MLERKILIIDDEPFILENLTELFSLNKWAVKTADNGSKALIEIGQFNPTVILSDINMPEMSGLQLLNHMYNARITTPVILITGYRDNENMKKAWEACVFDFLDKPYDEDHLLRVASCAHEYGPEYVLAAQTRFEKIKKKTA